MIERLLFAI